MRTLISGVGVALAFLICYLANGLRRNIKAVKASDLPYVVAPCSPAFLPWLILSSVLIPLIKCLPERYWQDWLLPITPDFTWTYRQSYFRRYGELFAVVSPGAIYLFCAHASAIHQIALRRDHFPKDTTQYDILRQFGENVITTEGAPWRAHRKATATSFNERNAALVFRQSAKQSLGLLRHWDAKMDGMRSRGEPTTLKTLEHDTMRLALNIIGYVGFGLSLPWPEDEMLGDLGDLDETSAKYGSVTPPEGFAFSFVDALATMLDNVLVLLLMPAWLLKILPSENLQKAVASRQDYNRFIDELLDLKIRESQDNKHATEGMDIMGQLVHSSYETGPNGIPRLKPTAALGRDEIKGNAFVMLVAGHETTANVLHFCLVLLAGKPKAQRQLHQELDELLGDKGDPETWDYDELLGPLMGGMVGACVNETLRLVPPVCQMPKRVTSDHDQVIVVDGRKHVLPKGATIYLNAAGVQRNPRYWPTKPSHEDPMQSDIHEYIPERWLRASNETGYSTQHDESQKDVSHSSDAEDDFGGYKGHDTSAQLFRPEAGAYIPFSDGARACLGRRIGQVEVLAALAVLLRHHSVELGVDEWANDEEVAQMGREEMTEVYGKAIEKMDDVISGARPLLTLKLRSGEYVPTRLVRRGDERFVSWMGDQATNASDTNCKST